MCEMQKLMKILRVFYPLVFALSARQADSPPFVRVPGLSALKADSPPFRRVPGLSALKADSPQAGPRFQALISNIYETV